MDGLLSTLWRIFKGCLILWVITSKGKLTFLWLGNEVVFRSDGNKLDFFKNKSCRQFYLYPLTFPLNSKNNKNSNPKWNPENPNLKNLQKIIDARIVWTRLLFFDFRLIDSFLIERFIARNFWNFKKSVFVLKIRIFSSFLVSPSFLGLLFYNLFLVLAFGVLFNFLHHRPYHKVFNLLLIWTVLNSVIKLLIK
jgi:hypothetical protein